MYFCSPFQSEDAGDTNSRLQHSPTIGLSAGLMEEVTDQSLAALDETQIAALSEWIANGGGVTIRSLKELSQEEREDILEYFQEMELFGLAFITHKTPPWYLSTGSLTALP